MVSRKTAWREAAWTFGLSRLVIVFLSVIGAPTLILGPFLHEWFHYDAVAYVTIAQYGYQAARDTVFFPLWPLLIHLLGGGFGGSVTAYYLAGLILANVCFYLALVVFYWLVSEVFEPTVARIGLFYLAFYPYALFFFAGYTESLFLLLCLAVFYLLRSERMRWWWLAGFLGGVAALTRPTGIVLVVPFLVLALQRFWLGKAARDVPWQQKLHALAPALLVPLGVVAYVIYLGITTGHPLSFSSQEGLVWHRQWALPWSGLLAAFQALFALHLPMLNLLDILFTLLPLVILVIGWRRLPLHYSLFAAAAALLALSVPTASAEPLVSVPRYLMVIFPIVIICALWSKQRRFEWAFVAVSLPMLGINIIHFINHGWVA